MRQTTTNEKVTRLHATEGSFDEIDGPLSPLTQRSPRDPHYRSSSDSRIYGGRIEEADEEEKDDTDNVGGHGSKTIPMPFSPPRSPLPTTASTSRSRLCSTTSNEDLWMENEQLRQKIEDLREEMKVLRRAYHDRTHLSLPDWKQNNPRVNNNNNNNNSKSSNSSKVLPRDESSGVVVELPRSMRRPLPMHQIFQGSTSSSRNHGATSIPKDHQSLGTCDNDDHSTDERPFIDWDIHKSASGLKKRSLLLLPPKSPKPALRRPQTFSADSISLDEGSFCCSDSGNDHLLDEEEGAGGVSSPSSSADVLVMETRGLLRPLIGGSSREGGGLPISPSSSSNRGWKEENFWSSASDRAGWLVGLLMMQSMSSFILARNEALLQKHLVIVRFLTMLVGAGGNAGNQASVRGESMFCSVRECLIPASILTYPIAFVFLMTTMMMQ